MRAITDPTEIMVSPDPANGIVAGETKQVGGIRFIVATARAAEQASAIVCVSLTIPLVYPDNRTGPCRDCGDTIQWRPSAPKRPRKICQDCYRIRMLREAV